MRRVLVLLPLCLVACHDASALRQEYAAGQVPAFARRALAGETTEPVASAPESAGTTDAATFEKARQALEEIAERYRAEAAGRPSDPARLGFEVAEGITRDRLRQPLDLPTVLGAAYELSPAVQSSRDSFRATVEQFSQVAFLDQLLRQYTAFTKDLDLRLGAPRQREMVEAYFPFPGTMALKSRVVEADAKVARADLVRTVRQTLVAAGRAYFQYVYAQEAIGIVKGNIDLLRGVVQIAESKYGVGQAKQGVVLKTQTEIATLEDELVTLEEGLGTARARLASILGLEPDFPLGAASAEPAVAPPRDWEPLAKKALASRQEIQALDAKIARTEALIELMETQAYPDLSLGSSRFEEGAGTRVGGARTMPPFADQPTSRPKPWFGESASYLQEVRRRLEAMQKTRDELVARIGFEVKDAWFRWDAAWRQTELYRASLLPKAEQSYRVLASGWQEGVAEFLDALDAQRTWLKFRLQERAAVRDDLSGRLGMLDAVGADLAPAEGKDK